MHPDVCRTDMTAPFWKKPLVAAPVEGFPGRLFAASTLAFVVLFVVGWLALYAADLSYVLADAYRRMPVGPEDGNLLWLALRGLALAARVLGEKEILAALWLSLWTSSLSVVIGLLMAIPIGYAMSRYRFLTHPLAEAIIDLPIILPPVIVGLSLLVFFQSPAGKWIENSLVQFVFQRKGIVLCQLMVSASLGIRAAALTFDGIDPRLEHVAMTLGCTRAGAFFRVALPMAVRGLVVAGILIWTRAFGLFGPLMVFVGAVRFRTEVLPTTIYLEQSVGRLEVALTVALFMVLLATVGLVIVRTIGLRIQK